MEEFKKFEEIFENYVNNIIEQNKDNEEIVSTLQRKKKHSYDVRDNMVKIAQMQGLHLDMFIVNFIGLFHDIGRFYQYVKYQTFNDAKSENHAKLSLKVLEDEKIISLVEYEKRPYIMDSILYHNMQNLPKNLDRKTYLYSALVRDADKLDGFRLSIVCSEAINSNTYYKGHSLDPIISDLVYDSILARKTIYKYDLKTVIDSQLSTLGYISSDINFDATIKIILENEYIEKMAQSMQDAERKQELVEFVLNYAKARVDDYEKRKSEK